MNKFKVRCSVCGKTFKTPSAKKTVCPSCEAEAKRARHVAAPSVVEASKPTTSTVDVRAALKAAQENQGQFGAYRPPVQHHAADPAPAPAPVHSGKPRPEHGSAAPAVARQQARPAGRGAPHPRPLRPAPAAKPERVRRQPVRPKPFVPTEEQIDSIRERYIALAQPEFDGIRHRIANELGIPLKAVKDVVKTIRAETATPSWWERTGAALEPEQIERIKAIYVPMLPEPVVGVHKQIAASLKLSHTSVYQAIGVIRAELELPRYTERESLPPLEATDAPS